MRTRSLVLAGLVLAILACSFGGPVGPPDAGQPPTPTASGSGLIPAADGGAVEGPLGVRLVAEPGALSADAQVTIEVAGTGVPFPDESPLDVVSPEFEIDLGGAEVTGLVTLSVPLPTASAARRAALAQPGASAYVAQTYTADGVPWMLGAQPEAGNATFQVVGPGLYQLYEILVPLIPSQFDPLNVPSYAQHTPAWCSPTAMTDLVQYHQGAWPAGGDGSVWGESSNWYLAGQAGQPFNTGYFFHWLVAAGGYAGVPGDVKQSFANNDLEVMIWFIGGTTDPLYNLYTWIAFKAYVESWLWGETMVRRPVAWGSSIAGHSRVITGSDGTTFYYNETSNGGINLTRAWSEYAAAAFAGDEIVDTVVLYHAPRPASQRRGVLRLNPAKTNDPGSIRLVRAADGAIAASWRWDGTGGRDLGYYYDDPLSMHTPDAQLDFAFGFDSTADYLSYNFQVANIATAPYDFQVRLQLYRATDPPSPPFAVHDSPAPLAPSSAWSEGGTTVIGDLVPGLYTLRFSLYQGSILQDVKYVKFRVAAPPLLLAPELIPLEPPFIPLGDPEISTPELFYRGVGCGPRQARFTIQALHPEAANVGLFVRLRDPRSGEATAFSPGLAMQALGDGFFSYNLEAESIPEFSAFEQAVLEYQFVLTDAAGAVLGRSPTYADVNLALCRR